MRIAYIYTALTTFGGVDRVLTEKANYLADTLGHDVYIITDSQAGRPPVFPLSEKVHHIDLKTDFDEQYHYGIIKRFFCYRRLMKQYRRRLEQTLYEIKTNITISTCGRDLDFLCDLTDGSIKMGESHTTKEYMRNFYLMKQRGFPFKLVASYWQRKQEKAICRLKEFVVLNQHDADSWSSLRGCTVIPNSLPFSAKEHSTLQNNRIISVGRLSVEKGADRLYEIWKHVSVNKPGWILDWYGHGPLHDEYTRKLDSENCQSFHLNEPTQDIEARYRQSDIYVLCSRFEGFGMVLIEAMSCGLPCIAFDCPHGPRTIIKDGVNGFLIPEGDNAQYIEKLELLMSDEKLRKEMSIEAIKTSQRYAPEIIMRQWDDLFKRTIQIEKEEE